MRNCLVVFAVWCIYLAVRGLKLAHSRVEIVQNPSSSLCSSNDNDDDDGINYQNFSADSAVREGHGRNKRYLLFEKGAAVSVTTAVVKTIVPGIPRGFNIICEESLYYDLPTTFSVPRKDLMKPVVKTKLPSKHQQGIRRKNGFQKHKVRNYNVEDFARFPDYYSIDKYDEFPQYNNYAEYDPYLKRRKFRAAIDDDGEKSANFLDVEAIFFEQIEGFAKRLGFNKRYCIMRTICESQHILFPKGQFLFHDVIRIIMESSLPIIEKNRKYLNALNRKHLMDCANLYGPHCKISFIDFFTHKILGISL